MKNFARIILTAIVLSAFTLAGLSQETFYGLQTTKELKTTDTKDLHRPGSCWANAGTAFLEAEWLRLNNTEMDIAELAFIRNAYLLKAEAYLTSDGSTRVDEKGTAFDVVALMAEYGLAPSDAFYKSEEKPMDARSGEMDAILRGTLQMVMEKENGVFSDRWEKHLRGCAYQIHWVSTSAIYDKRKRAFSKFFFKRVGHQAIRLYFDYFRCRSRNEQAG
jgi:hypothetical protein